MFERFVRDAHYAALEATSVAAGLGSSSVEAEHLLISIASGKSKAAHALNEVGLEPQEIRDAVQRDFERALLAVGVDAERRPRPRQLPPHKAALGRLGPPGARARAGGGQASR